MYDELVKELRNKYRAYVVTGNEKQGRLFKQAANAIEELVRKEKFHAFLWNTIQPNEMEQYISMYNSGNEKVETK